jgi:hypothetical protein
LWHEADVAWRHCSSPLLTDTVDKGVETGAEQ